MATKVPKTFIQSIDPSQIDSSGATGGQVLTFNGSTSTWVASAAPSVNVNNLYTTVGNASAGIFVKAVCFIPSDPGSGTWTAPAGCYTARVTIVGGGASGDVINPLNGTRSHFNYPTGSSTGSNQLFANGGFTNTPYNGSASTGGSAGWNGLNGVAVSININIPSGGRGATGNGGFGGAGGGGSGRNSSNGGGGSYGRGGSRGNLYGGGSGGISGDGSDSIVANTQSFGGGSPTLSYAALSLSNYNTAISENVGQGARSLDGAYGSFGGGGWCSAIVSVTPGQSYTYAVGAAGGAGASHGMVVIEW